MVALKLLYDHGHGSNPVIVHNPSELGQVLDELLATRPTALVEMLVANNPAGGLIDVGFDGRRGVGVVYYAGPTHQEGCMSSIPDHPGDVVPVQYYHMTSNVEFPSNAEVPAAVARAAALEFMATGGARPNAVQWQSRPPSVAVGDSEWPD